MKTNKVLISLLFIVGLFVYPMSTNNSYTGDSYNKISLEDSDYNEGWEAGFCEGWKDVKGQYSICPIPPIAPIPKIDCNEGYRCGYNRGFKYGMCKANGYSTCRK